MKENNEKKIKNCEEISKLIKAFPKDIAALDKRSVLFCNREAMKDTRKLGQERRIQKLFLKKRQQKGTGIHPSLNLYVTNP